MECPFFGKQIEEKDSEFECPFCGKLIDDEYFCPECGAPGLTAFAIPAAIRTIRGACKYTCLIASTFSFSN